MDVHLGNITPYGDSLLINPQKLHRWYRDSLSGFLDPQTISQRHRHDIEIKKQGIKKRIRVPILSLENFGEDMAIDEKLIGEEVHTILSNRTNGKIALLACSVKASELIELLPSFNLKGFDVKSITRDLSPSYDWFCRQVFCNARHVADKFHIIRHLLNACQDVRVRYRQEELTRKRIEYQAFKDSEKERKKKCRINGELYKHKNFYYKEKRMKNGETLLEILARSRYLLYKYPNDLTENQRERAQILFELFPEINESYLLSCEFRDWYKKENIGEERTILLQRLQEWYKAVDRSEIPEMENFKSLVERNQEMIMNYFVKGETNAIAECINSKIQRFISVNQGTRDREFFYFRIANFFTSTSK
ncbi:MAG: transposase [Sphaerochaetaceae bacterium]